jgi:hypothetical protein
VNLLLICANDLEPLALEHIVDDAQKHGHVAKQLRRDALARRVDGNLTARAGKHERSRKHADADGFAEPGTRKTT